MGVPFSQLPVLAYWTILRSKSLLSVLVDSLFGLLLIWVTMCSMSILVMALMSAPSIMRNSTGIWVLHLEILPSESPRYLNGLKTANLLCRLGVA